MNVYVASKFENQVPVKKLQSLLKNAGHTISYDWTSENPDWSRRTMAEKDLDGVISADAIVLICYPKLSGAMVELGICIATRKHIVVVDSRRTGCNKCIFYDLPMIKHVRTIEDAVKEINLIK